jgi:UDP-N-acetylglucosamine 4,6-dehydratase
VFVISVTIPLKQCSMVLNHICHEGCIILEKDRSILVTGGTGSFGRHFITSCLNSNRYQRIVVFSRDELKQYELRSALPQDERLRWFLGDVRDIDRLRRALQGIDVVVHAAALKQVDTAEYNPFEFVKTNVFGSQNLIEAAIDSGVSKVIALSTDKASSPINLYGATKLTADKLFISGNHYGRPQGTIFSVVRYGNVVNSRGSVVPLLLKQQSEGSPFTITDHRMTRFWLSLEYAVNFVEDSLDNMLGGELFVPKIPSMKIADLVVAINPDWPIKTIGMRPGEKLHEEMISLDEGRRAFEFKNHFVVIPSTYETSNEFAGGKIVPEGFRFSSDNNAEWLTSEQIKHLIGQK